MQPIDYLNDVIKPTVKVRFISKRRSEVFYRFDMDNDVQLKNINCNYVFSLPSSKNNNNHLILIDYDKGCFNKDSIKSLFNYIESNNINISDVILNTKPHKLHLFIPLLKYVIKDRGNVIIQMNESEFEPFKDEICEWDWYTYFIVTRGTKDVLLYSRSLKYDKLTAPKCDTYDVTSSIVDNVPTTSGCGDQFLAEIIFCYLYNNYSIENSIISSIIKMKQNIIDLNNKLFNCN